MLITEGRKSEERLFCVALLFGCFRHHFEGNTRWILVVSRTECDGLLMFVVGCFSMRIRKR